MKKVLVNPYVVKLISVSAVQEPIPGTEAAFYINNQLATGFVSENFLRISRLEFDVVVLGKLKYLLFKMYQQDLTKNIEILTDSLAEIDSWPKITPGELELWKAFKNLSLYHSSECIKDHLLKTLFEQEKENPGLAISVAALAAKMNTSRTILIPTILELEKAEMLKRGGDANFVHASDWINLTENGDRYVDENFIMGGIKVKLKK